MSRLDEALRRAGQGHASPETFNVASSRALDWFAPAEGGAAAAATRKPKEPEPTTPPKVSAGPLTDIDVAVADGDAVGPNPLTHSTFADHLVVSSEIRPSVIEQYRKIAAVLHHQRERGIQKIMVTSALPAEGKTLTSVNLALTISESFRRRVLLIDADLRRPMVHEAFGIPNEEGLSTVLNAAEDRTPPAVGVTKRLAVIPSGGHDLDPMGGLTSDRMRRLVQEAAKGYDFVIIDTPPVALLPDAKLLSSMVDGAVLVIRASYTPLKSIQHAVEAVGREKIMGVVLNGVDPQNVPAHFGGGNYGYYGYYLRPGSPDGR